MSNNITTAQMQSALAKINPKIASVQEAVPPSPINVADLIADTGAGVVAFVTEAGSNAATFASDVGTGTATFAERVKVRYQYQRAVRKGLINEVSTPAVVKSRRNQKAS